MTNFNFATAGKALYVMAGVVMFAGFFLTAGNFLNDNRALEQMCLVGVQSQKIAYNRCN